MLLRDMNALVFGQGLAAYVSKRPRYNLGFFVIALFFYLCDMHNNDNFSIWNNQHRLLMFLKFSTRVVRTLVFHWISATPASQFSRPNQCGFAWKNYGEYWNVNAKDTAEQTMLDNELYWPSVPSRLHSHVCFTFSLGSHSYMSSTRVMSKEKFIFHISQAVYCYSKGRKVIVISSCTLLRSAALCVSSYR